jgi:glycosyltransferase involved in cell wall biosynthesis
VIRKPVNEGVGLARRDAIAASSGELVAMIDADDYWLPDHLEVVLECFERHGGIVSARGVRWVPTEVLGTTPWTDLSPVPRPSEQAREILRRNFLLSAVLFARTAYDEAGASSTSAATRTGTCGSG